MVRTTINSTDLKVHCGHDGYRRLRGQPLHWRSWTLSGSMLTVHDRIEGGYQSAIARLYLHPSVTAQLQTDSISLQLPNGRRAIIRISGGRVRLTASEWYPEFGCTEAAQCVHIEWQRDELLAVIDWR